MHRVDLDPNKENVVTWVSIGPSLYRALVAPGVPIATVENLDSYGLLTDISPEDKRDRVLDRYKKMYSSTVGTGPVMDFLSQTGLDALKGADIDTDKYLPKLFLLERNESQNLLLEHLERP